MRSRIFLTLLALATLLGIAFFTAPEKVVAPTQTRTEVKTTQPKATPETALEPKKEKPPIETSTEPTTATPTIESLPVLPTPPATTTPTNPVNYQEINLKTREALVNILCTTKTGGSFAPLTGSGVLIDDRGIILTNAHIAQYFLLFDYTNNNLECIIRQGSPAQPLYTATLLFISPDWVRDHAADINKDEPKGTGENDFALLKITDSTDPNRKLPARFPALEFNTDKLNPSTTQYVLLAAYPAEYLGGIAIQKDLYIISTITDIKKVYTFGNDTPDLISLGGSPTAQKGSSGGAVVDSQTKLIGLISTESTATTTDAVDLHAITLSHIDDAITKQSGQTFYEVLADNPDQFGIWFKNNLEANLTKLLTDELDKR